MRKELDGKRDRYVPSFFFLLWLVWWPILFFFLYRKSEVLLKLKLCVVVRSEVFLF